MSQERQPDFDFIVLSPPGDPEASLAIAASRWGAVGVLNLEFCRDPQRATSQLARLAALGHGRYGVQIDGGDADLLHAVLDAGAPGMHGVLLTAGAGAALDEPVAAIHQAGLKALLVVTDEGQARAGIAAGIDALIAKGCEAGGWVGDETALVLLQRLLAATATPVWVQGGIGCHSVAACYVAGAAGAVLDSQVLLTRESPLPERVMSRLRTMDGSETVCGGLSFEAPFRSYSRPDLSPSEEVRRLDAELTTSDEELAIRRRRWRAELCARVDWRDPERSILAVGQDAALAGSLARRFHTVGGVLSALRESAAEHCRMAEQLNSLREHGPLAQSHGTRYPIVQGPMTRVSDRAQFAQAVAEAGALPFLALALMRGPEVRRLLEETRSLLGERPWGVGILGFVPPELRTEQMEVILQCPPTFAIIAGGRPDQALALERQGIPTYLHVPSPGLLDLFLKEGSRRFVFEGRECGGHTGPRTSFVLWESMIDRLLEAIASGVKGPDLHLLFAGGVHDGLSASMVAAMAAPLAERGVRIGVLMGTAYLFTREAVESGAITAGFQEAALACSGTVLLESGPGQTTRCAPSPFVQEFQRERRALMQRGLSPEELKNELEALNIGRLRIASKGVDHNPDFGVDPAAPRLVEVPPDEQRQRGMYMIGQVAALRGRVCTLDELHRRVSSGSTEKLAAASIAVVEPEEPAPPPASVAIVGIGCVMPGAHDLATYWSNILNRVDAITEVPQTRWDWRLYYDQDRSARDKTYSRWGGFIPDLVFDPMDFGMPPASLRSIEPFQLLTLLVTRSALEDAGYLERPFNRQRTSVIFGAGGGGGDLSCGYVTRSSLLGLFGQTAPELTERLGPVLPEWTEDTFAGLLLNVVSGRVANRFDLGGANFTVDAACASSLAAVYLGVRELEAKTSDVAIVGGVDTLQNPFTYLCFSKTQAHSPTGHCRTFDAQADGIAISEGVVALVLKRLQDAERDGDRVYAVIRGAGASSDGRDRSLTAPRPEGQMRALKRAYAQAGFSPASVGLIEAHGTGTVAGDQAEVQALTSFFSGAQAASQTCAIGSVKSMVGHTKATAGVAGLTKVALALHHRVLPPTLGVTQPNPKANFPASPFYVNTEARPWMQPDGSPRRAGVSAFGFGGTNFHVVAEEYTGGFLPKQEASLDRWPAELLLWRGTPKAIQDAVAILLRQLAAGAQPRLADLAFTLDRLASESRPAEAALAVVASSLEELHGKLQMALEVLASGQTRHHGPRGIHYSGQPFTEEGAIAFLFPGQGSQYVNMARDLTVIWPEAREPFELADRVLRDRFEQPLSGYVFPRPVFGPEEEKRLQAALTDTNIAQPALGAAGLALLRVLRALGVEAAMAAGHSYGEFVALCAAGAFDEETLLRLSEARGRFMREGAGEDSGTMAAIDAPPDALAPLLDGGITLANFNAPRQTVISGSRAAVERAVVWCREQGLTAHPLSVSCAFHSPLVAPAQQRLAALLADAAIQAPRMTVYSNTTAAPYPQDPSEIVRLLAEHLAQPVRFVSQIEAMHAAGARIFVEVGPRSSLSGLVSRILDGRPHMCVALDQPGKNGLVELLHGLAALAVEGVDLRWVRLFRGRSVELVSLDRLAEAGSRQLSPTSWLVNGGRARPAAEPELAWRPLAVTVVEPGAPGRSPMRADGAQTAAAGNGQSAGFPSTAPPTGAIPVPDGPAAPVQRSNGAADPMDEFQRLMRHFLDTQRSVMLTYLGSDGPADDTAEELPGQGTDVYQAPQPTVQEPAAGASAEPLPQPEPSSNPTPGPNTYTAVRKAAATAAGLAERLLTVVSDRTGYPVEMLALDADLEADLGIDSIKRVEIAGTLVQSLDIPGDRLPPMERLTTSRTLQQVIDLLLPAIGGAVPVEEAPKTPRNGHGHEEAPPSQESSRTGRYRVVAEAAPPAPGGGHLSGAGPVLVVDDASGVGAELARLLEGRGCRAVRIVPPGTAQDGSAVIAASLRGEEAVDQVVAAVRERWGPVVAVVNLAALRQHDITLEQADWDRALEDELYGFFLLTRALESDLRHAASSGGAAVVAATCLGGSFAVGAGRPDASPRQGALAGFVKTLAIEWPDVAAKCVDVATTQPAEAAALILSELLSPDGLVEVGYGPGGRVRLGLTAAPVAGANPDFRLDRESVVLVTGGGRGITAQVALRLATTYHPALVLVGRTPAPTAAEPVDTAGIEDAAALKQALIARRRSAGLVVTPALVEDEYRRLLQVRELRTSLTLLREQSASVEYIQCDASDRAAFEVAIAGVYERYGRIDGVIHGAGVIEDKLIRDKKLESFRRVVETKITSALTLARVLRPEHLRFLVMFSSVSGRFGNRGQADYAAASEMLNKLAQYLDRQWPAHVVSINWGPWLTTGMVSPEVRRQFAERGVELISVDAGCRHFMEELTGGRKGEVEVVIGGASGLAALPPPEESPGRSLSSAGLQPLLANTTRRQGQGGGVSLRRVLDVNVDRYLADHQLDGRPVLPFAFALELMAEAAAESWPELRVLEVRQQRLLRGVVLESGQYAAGITLRPVSRDERRLGVEALIAAEAEPERAHYRALVVLGPPAGPETGQEPRPEPLRDVEPFPMETAEAYREWLFHGPTFQRIQRIDGISPGGASSILLSSAPADCLAGNEGSWLFDPVLVDAALQVQVLWARRYWDITLLPSSVASYRRFEPLPPAPCALRHELRIRDESREPSCRADHYFYGPDGRLLMTITDVEGTGSKALNRLAAAAQGVSR